jgi:tetratricopeptide (TPR) repeat protein
MSAAYTGNLSKAEEAASRLKILRDGNQEKGRDYQSRDLDVMYKELSAIVLFEQGKKEEALKMAGKAAAEEEMMDPPSGPPNPLKPSHELYGELLLAAGKYDEAKTQFEIALLRMPYRSLSLLGLGRAATHLGDVETATEAFTALQRNWANSDSNNPDLAVVRGYKTSEDQ